MSATARQAECGRGIEGAGAVLHWIVCGAGVDSENRHEMPGLQYMPGHLGCTIESLDTAETA